MKKILFTVFIFFVFCVNISAQINWSGRFYEQAMIYTGDTQNDRYAAYMGLSVLDLGIDARPSDLLRVRGELEFAFTHPDTTSLPGMGGIDLASINTLNATFTPGRTKITVGRFLPRWGVCSVFRPLDLFAPQLYFLNAMSFKGIDGISVKYYLSDLSSFEILEVPASQLRYGTTASNAQFHTGTFDYNLIFLYDGASTDKVLGLAFKGDLILGVSGELYYRFRDSMDYLSQDSVFKASVGLDYSFAKYFFVSAGFFYDESGKADYRDYAQLDPTSRMTLGTQYLESSFVFRSFTDMTIGLGSIFNLDDKSFILYPYYQNEIFENCQLGVSLYNFNGESGREFSSSLMGSYVFNAYLLVKF